MGNPSLLAEFGPGRQIDPGEELEVDLAHGEVTDRLQGQPDASFPAGASLRLTQTI